MDPQRLLGIGHGAIGEPFPAVPASASQRALGQAGGDVDLDGVVIQSSMFRSIQNNQA